MKRPSRGQPRKALFNKQAEEIDISEREDDALGRSGDDTKIERQLRELLEAMEAVRRGDLSRRLKKGKEDIFGEIADSYNAMTESLTTFSGEVTRVAKEVGTEGKLGGQARWME